MYTTHDKPNRVTTTSKDEKYHSDFAEWALSSYYSNPGVARWLKQIEINKKYSKGDQWASGEDLNAFLTDESGNERSRIKVVLNQIRPLVEQFRGNGSILKINASAKSSSKLSVNRRDLALSKKIFDTQLANEAPALGKLMRERDPSIGKDENHTTQIFTNLYVDVYIPQINGLMKYCADLNQLARTQIRQAMNLALTGVCSIDNYTHGGHVRSRVVKAEDLIYDGDAEDQDLSDGSFKGFKRKMDVSYLLERYQVDPTLAKEIEEYTNGFGPHDEYSRSGRNWRSTNRPTVYTIYWKDSGYGDYGYVNDEYGYSYLTRINFTYPGEQNPRYTDEDLIPPPETEKNKMLFKNGAKKRKCYFDEMRYCVFLSKAYMNEVQKGKSDKDRCGTLVLEHGLLEYQEKDVMDENNAKFPIKSQTWGYLDGEIFTPVDDAINPQRLINRIVSVFEAQINASGGAGVIVDGDAADEDINYNIKEGNAIQLDTRGRGIPNSIGNYDATPKAGTFNLLNVIPIMQGFTQQTTGVNEALKGESIGSDQLVGVTQSMIQRGSLMQEPFYFALADLYMQTYQYYATVGKDFYIDNERELAIAVGDDGAQIIKLAKGMKNEDFRVFITREMDSETLKANANQMLWALKEYKMISDKVFAHLFDRSTPDDVTAALREQAGIREEAEKQAAEQRQLAEQEMVQEARNDKEDAREFRNRVQDDQNDLELSRQEKGLTETLIKEEAKSNFQ
jgi:hypothetical protein